MSIKYCLIGYDLVSSKSLSYYLIISIFTLSCASFYLLVSSSIISYFIFNYASSFLLSSSYSFFLIIFLTSSSSSSSSSITLSVPPLLSSKWEANSYNYEAGLTGFFSNDFKNLVSASVIKLRQQGLPLRSMNSCNSWICLLKSFSY